MTSDVWQPPEYVYPKFQGVLEYPWCSHCGAQVVNRELHTKWHFRDSVRGRDSYGADLRITEQQVKDYGYRD